MDSRTIFEKERDNLVDQVAQGLEQVIANMSLLNRNLETIITIGRDFENVASLWSNFQAAIVTNKDGSNEEGNV
ncbi:DASH complex subunit Dad1-domain-containing protein [Jimgerdemannia flammicorona]|uniref:DASH complex subunit DAD1 n=1 Tax=Jimgerdemannia flammicorona TaxID=994334 RepID=A0A433DCG2_9FUNG|nr:DASH complex subunit Dad1-domain-containing protein [Jimgerdemannia flammicorona]